MYAINQITFNSLHKQSLHQTYIQWANKICIDIKNRLLFVFIVSFVCIRFYSVHVSTVNKVVYFCVKKTFPAHARLWVIYAPGCLLYMAAMSQFSCNICFP